MGGGVRPAGPDAFLSLRIYVRGKRTIIPKGLPWRGDGAGRGAAAQLWADYFQDRVFHSALIGQLQFNAYGMAAAGNGLGLGFIYPLAP